MLNKLKYIITTIMLVIFPLSAMGFSISIHKCSNSANFRFHFIKIIDTNADCCCNMALTNGLEKNDNVSIKSNKLNNQLNKFEINNTIRLNHNDKDCKRHTNNSNNFNFNNNEHSDKSEVNINNRCCSNNHFISSVNIALITEAISNLSLELPEHFFKIYNSNLNFENNINEIKYLKDNKIPIHRQLRNIISCIHFNSQSSDEASAISI